MLGERARARDEIPMQDDSPEAARRLARGYAALVALTFALIVLGALVRAHGAGLACPDWPLCFGELVPTFDLRVGFEWSHRVLAGGVALLFAALAALTLRRPELRADVGPAVAAAGVLLGVQILLGALTVWQLLASWTVTSHLVIGNAFALTALWIAADLRDRARGGAAPERAPAAAAAAVVVAAALLGAQLVLGGLVSSQYAGLACPDWPACRDGVWFPAWEGAVGLHLLHRWNAVLLLAALAAAAWASRGVRGLRGPAAAAVALGTLQLGVGVANVWLGIPVEVTGLHSALAAALVLTWTLAVRALAQGRRAAPAPA